VASNFEAIAQDVFDKLSAQMLGANWTFLRACPSFGGVNYRCQDCGVGRVDMTARIDMIGLPVGQQMYLYHRRLLTIDIPNASLQT
jgi:hypothetical protein